MKEEDDILRALVLTVFLFVCGIVLFIFSSDMIINYVNSEEKERIAEFCNERGFERFYRDGSNRFVCYNLGEYGERVNVTTIYWRDVDEKR